MKSIRFRTLAGLISIAGMGMAGFAQGAAGPSLQELLKPMYKLTVAATDAEGFKIVEPGTVLTVMKGGIIAVPQDPVHVHVPHWGMCSNTFKGGTLATAKNCAMTTAGSKLLPKGTKVYVTKFEVNQKSNKISFNLVECDSCNGVTTLSSMKATVTFEFDEKFLDTAEPGQVTDVIGEVLAPDSKGRAEVLKPMLPGTPYPAMLGFASDGAAVFPALQGNPGDVRMRVDVHLAGGRFAEVG